MKKKRLLHRRYYQEVLRWFDQLEQPEQKNFGYLLEYVYSFSHIECMRQDQMRLVGLNLNISLEDDIKFIDNEIYNGYRELRKTKISVDWESMRNYTLMIVNENKNQDNETKGSRILIRLNEFAYLFWSIIHRSKNIQALLSHPIDFHIKPEDCEMNIPELNEMIDFIGMYMSIINLRGFKEEFKSDIKGLKNAIITKPLTFKELFIDETNAKKVVDILELKGYTLKGQWKGITGAKSELLSAYYALRHILKPSLKTPQIKTFYRAFGLPDDYMSDRMMTDEPINQSRNEFERIFSHLMPK